MPTRYWVLVLVTLLGAAPALAQTPTVGSWREEVRRLRDAAIVQPARGAAKTGKVALASRLAARPPTSALVESIVAESEPNDSVRTADSVALGDQATGVVNPANDVDTWLVDLTAGQLFSVDVDAAESGSPLDATLVLFAPDGRTVVAFNDDFDGADSRISYRVPASGRHYVMISSFGRLGGSPLARYAVNFGSVICTAVGTEREPNDAPGTATPIAIGDSGSGEVCPVPDRPAGDVDYWAFTAQAGTTLELDIDAVARGFLVDPVIALYASDGTTQLAFKNDGEGADPRLHYPIPTTGTYFATVAAGGDPASTNPFPYTLHVRSLPPGPGDPTRVVARGFGFPLGLAVGSTGDLFVGDLSGSRVARISSQGAVTTFTSGVPNPISLAFDAAGQLLVSSLDGAVYRVTPQGQATRFITDAVFPFWVAVAPDGRIWLTNVADRSLRRYSLTGQLEAQFDGIVIGGSGPGPLAIGPSGEPYVSNGTEIWRLRNSHFERVLTDRFLIWAFAFDVAGDIYLPLPTAARVKLVDATGTALADPFVVGVDAPQVLAFGRDGTGATVARLFATDPAAGRVIEVKPAGVAHPGQPLGYIASISPDVAAASLLGGGGLSAADVQYLDGLGNRNGRYDVGDLQAYLRTVGGLPGTAAAAQWRPGSER